MTTLNSSGINPTRLFTTQLKELEIDLKALEDNQLRNENRIEELRTEITTKINQMIAELTPILINYSAALNKLINQGSNHK